MWKRPKNIWVGLTAVEAGTASAVINFNNSMVGMLRILAKLGVIPDSNCTDYCNHRDHARINTKWTKKIGLSEPSTYSTCYFENLWIRNLFWPVIIYFFDCSF